MAPRYTLGPTDPSDAHMTSRQRPQEGHFSNGTAWVTIGMPDDETLVIRGEWHASWLDVVLTTEALRAKRWQDHVGVDLSIVARAGAVQAVEACVAWMLSTPQT